MSIGLLMSVLVGALSPRTRTARNPRRPRNIVHVASPEPLGKRAKRRARGKSKDRK